MLPNFKNILETEFKFSPNKNQIKDLERLVFEIIRRENISLAEIITYLKNKAATDKYSAGKRFFCLKNALIQKRFPLTATQGKIDTKKLFLSKLPSPLNDNWQVKEEFVPLEIIVEKDAKGSPLVKNFQKKFPQTPLKIINRYSDYLKQNKFTISELKKPLIFITKEKQDFLKCCPCTRGHLNCGYWIFNLGFGCPFDCSYCFLQQYANFPGIILAANLEDFFKKFNQFAKKLKKPLRIGTGEFSDSLALDNITGYSQQLIPYFKKKNVLLELKTKSAQITNLLNIEPSPNIIISWSLNPSSLIKTEEKGTADLKNRLEAAREIQQKGYRLGFHFDPIIYSENWKESYKEVIDDIYRVLKAPFAWISLGTLRSHRQLKKINELRFPESKIFYEELFIAEDKKLRYPKFLRKQIYEQMVQGIREYDKKTPLYLCMEDTQIWSILGNFDSSGKIEKYLTRL